MDKMTSEYRFDPSQVINAKEAMNPTPPPKREPKIDPEISKIAGKPIRINDRRVVNKVMEWRRRNPIESERPDNFLKDPKKREELRKELNK